MVEKIIVMDEDEIKEAFEVDDLFSDCLVEFRVELEWIFKKYGVSPDVDAPDEQTDEWYKKTNIINIEEKIERKMLKEAYKWFMENAKIYTRKEK